MSSIYTVALNDATYGRVVLDPVTDVSVSAAKSQANAAPPVSGTFPGGGSQVGIYSAGQVVDQKAVLAVSGKDTSGNAIAGPSGLPTQPTQVSSPLHG